MKYIEMEDISNSIKEILYQAIDNLYQIIIVDKNGFIAYINSYYAQLLGVKRSDVIGNKIEKIVPDTKLYETLETGIPVYNDTFVFKDGRSLIYSRIPIKTRYGEIIGAIAASSINPNNIIEPLYQKIHSLEYSNRMYARQLQKLSDAPNVFNQIIGVSPQIIEIKRTLSKVSNSRMPILITGESGTGKEVFASAIHNSSNRRNAPFVKVNCAAIPRELLESELFGYETGTFSGAVKGGRPGKFELANNGTVLLDEIEELPLDMQSKLLRVLQEYEVERIGSIKPTPLNVQFICCSNKNLYQMTAEKQFREDLLYRINVMEIQIPPLRERMEDLPLLCSTFIKKTNSKYKLKVSGISYDALQLLRKYNWPGNVRELEHAIERACVLTSNNTLVMTDFQFILDKKNSLPVFSINATTKSTFNAAKQSAEKQLIISALDKCLGNKSAAAKTLGISRSLLYSKLRKYNLI